MRCDELDVVAYQSRVLGREAVQVNSSSFDQLEKAIEKIASLE